MKTLVTGGTGLVGNNVVRLLLERGDSVRVFVRKNSDPRPFEGLDVEKVYGDVRDADSVQRAVRGIDAVIHSAAQVTIGWTGLELARAINVGGTRHVACAAREAGVRMVHVSTVDALGIRSRENPADEETPPNGGNVPCPYVLTKREAEVVLLDEVAKGLDAVIVNPAFMLGPWDWKPSSGRALLHVAKGRAFIAPPGGNNFCDVRDVACGILSAREKGRKGRRYILGGENLSYYEAFTLFAEITGARKPIGVTPRWVLTGIGKMGDFWTKLSGKETDINSASIAFGNVPHYFSIKRAEKELGFHPRPVREAVQAAWEWFQKYGYA